MINDSKYLGSQRRAGSRRRPTTSLQAARWTLESIEDDIIDIFVRALRENDAEKIIELAQAVLFFKQRDRAPVDFERGLLLFAKAKLIMNGKKLTVRQVAEYLNGGGSVETRADGFSSLRRKCRELDFPLAPSRQIRRK